MTINQQQRAVNYTLIFLKNEIEYIKKSIRKCTHETSKKLLIKRLDELEKDLVVFEELGDRI